MNKILIPHADRSFCPVSVFHLEEDTEIWAFMFVLHYKTKNMSQSVVELNIRI